MSDSGQPPLERQPEHGAAMPGLGLRGVKQPVLGVKRKLWRKDDEHADQADAAFASIRAAVLQRDRFTCGFCGFQAAKRQEVHHLDDDHRNNAPANLLTVCTLCHQVHHLGMCAMREAGFLAAIPELTQTEVNHLARAIHVADRIADNAVRDKLKSLYALFQYRGADTLKTLFGVDISVYALAELLSTCPEDVYARRGELLAPLRLVATEAAFHPGQLDYYAVRQRSLFLPDAWSALARQLLSE